MSESISEKKYPIRGRWILKSFIGILPGYFFILFYVIYKIRKITNISSAGISTIIPTIIYFQFSIFFLIPLSHIFVVFLKRHNFHYELQEKFFKTSQGIISKQQRNTPYGVIQSLYIKQDLLDRLLGLASLVIENASFGTGLRSAWPVLLQTRQQRQREDIGSMGNKINIPGLLKEDAEALKRIILEKMKENPVEDSQSGL